MKLRVKEEAIGDTGARGLCANCVHASKCSLGNTGSGLVFACEEHEAEGGRGAHGRVRFDVAPATRGLEGLCADCESKGACSLPEGESGIWHCEEYR